MPPIAQLLEDLANRLNSPAGQAALGGMCPARRGYQETQSQAAQKDATIWVSPDQWRELGRCGGLRLEQHLVNVRFLHTQQVPDNAAVDVDVDLATKAREFLQDYVCQHGGRVTGIIGPLTLDRSKLTFPGQSAIGLLLDCEILTGETADDADPEEPGLLTVARNAFWDAIDNWPALTDVFQRKYKSSADFAELQLRDPAPHELPAIAVYWGDIAPELKYQRADDWPMSLNLALWLPGDRHTFAETLAEDVFNALYQACPDDSTVSYIRAATGFPPKRVSKLTVQGVTLGRSQLIHALRVDVAFTLRSSKDPFGDGSP